MISTLRTDANHRDFIELVKLLDIELAIRDGEDHAFYSQFNKTNNIKCAVVAYEGDNPLACGAIKPYALKTMEVKRMYVRPEKRGNGIAAKVLTELEQWAVELAMEKCILETGKNQPEAIRLYTKCGYERISNYGQYVEVENSVCYEKNLLNKLS